MITIHARIVSAVEMLQRAVMMQPVSLVMKQIAVRHGLLIAVHTVAESSPSSVQRIAASSRQVHRQGRCAVRSVIRVHSPLLRQHRTRLRVTDVRVISDVPRVLLDGVVRELAGNAVGLQQSIKLVERIRKRTTENQDNQQTATLSTMSRRETGNFSDE